MKRLDLIIGVALLAVAVGCSSNTLTRAKAKALLETKAPATVDIILVQINSAVLSVAGKKKAESL